MKISDLISHLKEVFEKEGNLEIRIEAGDPAVDFPLLPEDIRVDSEKKTVTFF